MKRLYRFFENTIPITAGYLLSRGIRTGNTEMWVAATVIEVSCLVMILTSPKK